MLSVVRLISESKEWHHFKSFAEIMPIIPLKIFKLNMKLSNQLNLMYETGSVDTQVQILTIIFYYSSRVLCSIRSEINKKAIC